MSERRCEHCEWWEAFSHGISGRCHLNRPVAELVCGEKVMVLPMKTRDDSCDYFKEWVPITETPHDNPI